MLVGNPVSDSDEEPYSTIFASLKHPIRRRILRMLSKKPMSFSEMLEALEVSSPFLTYHLENLGELVFKTDDGKYRLSSFGEAAITTMTKVEDIPITILQQSSEHSETRSQKQSGPLGIFSRRVKTDEAKPRKAVRRSVAIALGIICIILIAGFGGAMAYYTFTISDKDRTLASLIEIAALAKSTVWVNNQTTGQTAGKYTSWTFSAQFAGFIVVHTKSTTNNTWVRVIYTTTLLLGNGTTLVYPYDSQIDVKSYDEDTVFPFLPGSANLFYFLSSGTEPSYNLPIYVEIEVGNTNTTDNATENVSITYYY
jgi:DNA-binding transcriptional ArsR family regulator